MADFEQVDGSKKEHELRLYAISTCGWCRKARSFLEGNDVAYEFVYVDNLEGAEQKKVVEEVAKLNPEGTFPTLVVDGADVIVGFNNDTYMDKLL